MLHLKMEKLLTKKFLGILVLGLLWCNTAQALDIFAENKILDYNFVCTSSDKAIKNDWSNIWNKFGFIRFGSGTNKVLLFSAWSKSKKHYNFHEAVVKKMDLNEEDYEFNYLWSSLFPNITYKNGEKGPMILFNILSKLKRHEQYYLTEKHIRISKEKYETLKRFDDDAFQYIKNDEKTYISSMERNRKIIFNLASKSMEEGKLDKQFDLVCKIEQ